MISFIRGTLVDVYSDRVIVENQGMGFEIWLSGSEIAHMPLIGAEITLYTYLHVREDAMMLFGFRTKADLETFKLLITVSGIGPKGGLAILSVLPAKELWMAVEMDDVKTISMAPGIGKKTAQKMIIELKDKLHHLEESLSFSGWDTPAVSDKDNQNIPAQTESADPSNQEDPVAGNGKLPASYREVQKDAVEALIALGYNRGEALGAVRAVKPEGDEVPDVEAVLKMALRNLI